MTSPGATKDHPDAINSPSNSEMNLYSASERVLGTPELLRTVLDLFDAGSGSEEESEGDVLGRKAKRADLASCARVSRHFSEHALDVLWRTLDSTLPLLRTLPSFRLIGKTWAFIRDITATEWARFHKHYTHRVRELRFEASFVDPFVWTLLARKNQDRPLLPNLQVIESPAGIPAERVNAIILFISPRIRAAYISFYHLDRRFSVRDVAGLALNAAGLLFNTLCDISPGITTLSWSGPFAESPMTYMRSIGRLQNLKCLTAGDVVADRPLILALSTIWSLAHLSITVKFSDTDYGGLARGLDPLAAFQGLRTLGLNGSARDVARSVSCMRPAALEELTLDITAVPILISTLPAFLSDVCQHLPQTLHTFTLSIVSIISPASAGPELPDHLWPLLSFKNLVHVEFIHDDPMLRVTDHGLSLLADAWPKLQSLRIDLPEPVVTSVRPTVRALVALAQRCPHLSSVSLSGLDARSLPPDASVPLVSDHPLEYIYAGFIARDTGDDQALRFATILDRLFPRLVEADLSDDVPDGPYQPQQTPFSMPVKHILGAIRSSRDHDQMRRERSAAAAGAVPGPVVRIGREHGNPW